MKELTFRRYLETTDRETEATVYTYDDCLTSGTIGELRSDYSCVKYYDYIVSKINQVGKKAYNVILKYSE